MSGTSADAVDAVLVRIGGASARAPEVLAFESLPLEEELRRRIHEACLERVALRDLVALDVELGERFAHAALLVARSAGVELESIEGIGSHGQTVGHFPEVHGTLQIGSAAVIHELTRIPVVADFRSADLAAGGQGAPLTPFLHHACLAAAGERRCVLNIGGFTNLSYLDGQDAASLIAFDPGPGNALIDRAVRWASEGAERYDVGGGRCARGKVFSAVGAQMLQDEYFGVGPPKSTGHEHFGAAFFERARDAVVEQGGEPDDVCATLAWLTVESVARAAESFLPAEADRWLVYGGGVHNSALMDGLRSRLGDAPVETTDDYGLQSDALEAICFALLGWCYARGRVSNIPSATGAQREVCLGSLTGVLR